MARYIDADALKAEISGTSQFHPAWNMTLALAILSEQPTADVAPVRHAGWVPNSINTHVKCSACGEPATLVTDDENFEYCEWYSPYCPHCGAKMDLEVQE